MRRATISSLLPAAALAALSLLTGCNPTVQAYCDLAADCDDFEGLLLDPIQGESDDNAAVCAVNQQTLLDALRANRESVCAELAVAYELWYQCAVEEGCAAFKLTENECNNELEDIRDLQDEAGNRCNE
jgi:hypothetical protein